MEACTVPLSLQMHARKKGNNNFLLPCNRFPNKLSGFCVHVSYLETWSSVHLHFKLQSLQFNASIVARRRGTVAFISHKIAAIVHIFSCSFNFVSICATLGGCTARPFFPLHAFNHWNGVAFNWIYINLFAKCCTVNVRLKTTFYWV